MVITHLAPSIWRGNVISMAPGNRVFSVVTVASSGSGRASMILLNSLVSESANSCWWTDDWTSFSVTQQCSSNSRKKLS